MGPSQSLFTAPRFWLGSRQAEGPAMRLDGYDTGGFYDEMFDADGPAAT